MKMSDAELIVFLERERDKWKSEYENVCKFATDYERQRDELRAETERLKSDLADADRVSELAKAECERLRADIAFMGKRHDENLERNAALRREIAAAPIVSNASQNPPGTSFAFEWTLGISSKAKYIARLVRIEALEKK